MTPPPTAPLSDATPTKKRSPFLIPAIVVLIILVFLGSTATVAWAVSVKHDESAVIRKLADVLPIPAAKLGSRTILYRDFLHSRDTLRTFLASPAAKEQQLQVPMDASLEKNVLEKMLAQAALEELATKKNVTVTDEELRQYFSEVVSAASSTTPDVGVYLLQNFGWNEEDFRQQVLRPALLEQRLTMALAQEKPDDQNALGAYMENRLKEKDVVRYLRY